MVATTSRVHVEHDVTVTVGNMRQNQKKVWCFALNENSKNTVDGKTRAKQLRLAVCIPFLTRFSTSKRWLFGIYDTIKSIIPSMFLHILRSDAISSGVVGDEAMKPTTPKWNHQVILQQATKSSSKLVISAGVKINIIFIYIYIYLNPHQGKDFPLDNPCHQITESKPLASHHPRKPQLLRNLQGKPTGKAEIRSFLPPKKNDSWLKNLVLQTLKKTPKRSWQQNALKRKIPTVFQDYWKKRVTEFGIVKIRTRCICRFLDRLSKRQFVEPTTQHERLEVGEVGLCFEVPQVLRSMLCFATHQWKRQKWCDSLV